MILLALTALAARPEEVALSFAWPSGVDLPVRVDVTEVVRAGGESRRRCFSVGARLRTQREETGLDIRFDDPTDLVPGDACPQFVELRPVLPTPFRVDGAGTLVEVDPRTERATRELWNRVVGYWVGHTAREAPETTHTERATPLLGWQPAPVDVTSRLADVGRRAERVDLSLVLTPDPAEVTGYFARLHASAPELGGSVGSGTLTESVRVRVAPLTLFPDRWEEQLVVTLTMADPPGSARREVTTVWTFGAAAESPTTEPKSKG